MLHSPHWHDIVKAINETPKGYKSPNYDKARIVLLEREKAKAQRALTRFTNEWVDCGVSIVSDGYTNVRNQHLINVLGVSASGAVFITCHDSISETSQNIADLLLQSIKDVGPNNVVQVITDNATNCKAWVFGVHIYGTYSKLQWLKLAKTRFAIYYLTFRWLVKVRQALTNMVTCESCEEINTDRDGANVTKDTILDNYFWSQIKYVLQFTKPIYYMIKFANSN